MTRMISTMGQVWRRWFHREDDFKALLLADLGLKR